MNKFSLFLSVAALLIFCSTANSAEKLINNKKYTWHIGSLNFDTNKALSEQFEFKVTPNNTHEVSYNINIVTSDSIEVEYEFKRKSQQLSELKITLSLLNKCTGNTTSKVVHLADIPSMAELNWPQRSLFKNKIMVDAISNYNQINFYWLNLPGWSVPIEPTWQENPYNNISWQMFYVSLGWLTSIGEHYKTSQSIEAINQIESLIVNFNNAFSDIETTKFDLIYREDAVSIRINHLLYLYLNFGSQLSEKASNALNNQIDNHFVKLLEYLNDPQHDDENHGLIQARSGLNLSAAFPFHPYSSVVKTAAINRVTKISAAMFSPVYGLSVEQSVDYHFVGISMLLEARAQIEKVGGEVPESLLKTLESAIVTGAYLLYSDGSAPTIGDSYYNGKWDYFVKRYYELLGIENSELTNFAENGQQALADSYLIAEEGLFIRKHHIGNNIDKFFFDFGKKRIVHGHFDNLNVLAELNSKKLLIDSGGPYTYSYFGRTNFWANSAQNNLLINNQSLNDDNTKLNYLKENLNMTAIQAEKQSNSGSIHSRSVIYSEHMPNSLLVFDNVNINEVVEEFWHFPPKTEIININKNLNQITLNDGSVFYHYHDELQPSTCKVREGEYDKNQVPSVGWVTPAYNLVEPAPVLYCKSKPEIYTKINLFTTQKLPVNNFKLSKKNNYKIYLKDIELTFDKNLNVFFRDDFPEDPNEWRDTDGDGIGNNEDLDDDNDGLNDQWETKLGLNPYSSDTDDDGISDAEEIAKGSDPLNPNEDSDGDGFSNLEEKHMKTDPYDSNDYPINIAPWIKVLYKNSRQ